MLSVVLLLLASPLPTDSSLPPLDQCFSSLERSFPPLLALTPEDVPDYCNHLRFEVSRCVTHKMRAKDDGSVSARGNRLIEVLKERRNDSRMLQMVRFYHYGCLYNDLAIWFYNPGCFEFMMQRCVAKADDCYGLICREKDKAEVINAPSHATTTVYPTLALLMIGILY